jgi:maltooligosyltrehalose trehalohydrolase
MTLFEVWVPEKSVKLRVDGTDRDMERGDDGWWRLEVPGAGPGTDYAYVLPEHDTPLPDPRSAWQPAGVHGPSRVYDHAAFGWTDGSWTGRQLPGSVLYELHVGTFTAEGTFDAAIDRLDHLVELGVDLVELLPVNAFNGEYNWGYDGVCWYAPHEEYGGPDGLKRLVDACHGRGPGVVLDVVYNHFGPSGNYLPEFGPYVNDRYRTPWGAAVNFDGPGSDEVRAFVLENAMYWLTEHHLDALRLDAVHEIIDQSALHLLAELADATASRAEVLRRPLALIAETDRNDPLTITPREAGGLGMDAQWADDLHHAIHVAVTGERDGYYADYRGLEDVAAAYARGFVYDGRHSPYRQRRVGAPLGARPGTRLVTCLQNHDQVGNRPFGDRLTTLAEPALVRTAAVLLCASPTTPMLFMGEEYGEQAPFQFFTSHPEPELAASVREGRRAELASFAAFGGREVPDPQEERTLTRSTLDHAGASTDGGRQRLALWTDLLALRRSHPALGSGRRDLVEVIEAHPERLVLVRGEASGARVLLAVNLAEAEDGVTLPPGSEWRVLLCSEDPHYGGGGLATADGDVLVLPPRSATLVGAPSPP